MTETEKLYEKAQAAIAAEKAAELALDREPTALRLAEYHAALAETTKAAQALFARVIALGKELRTKT